jgi:hypothetical protein
MPLIIAFLFAYNEDSWWGTSGNNSTGLFFVNLILAFTFFQFKSLNRRSCSEKRKKESFCLKIISFLWKQLSRQKHKRKSLI